MRQLIVVWLLLAGISISAQIDCKKYHDGTFEIGDETTGISIIERKGNKQYETHDATHYKGSYDVIWINDCTYVVKNRKVITGTEIYPAKETDEVTVEIIGIAGNEISVRISSNFNTAVFESKMKYLK